LASARVLIAPMTAHLRRIRAYMEHETKALLVAAERARLLDHMGNRGSEVEHTIRSWLHERVSPKYAVSSGEIIDSYDTDPDHRSRQLDCIVHTNDVEARRFLLPSGLRLVPIETVAVVVEIKLTLTKEGVLEADAAARQTASLKLAIRRRDLDSLGVAEMLQHDYTEASKADNERAKRGVPLSDQTVAYRTRFTIIGVDGPEKVETLAEWLKETTTINTITCLSVGSATRHAPSSGTPGYSYIYQRDEALLSFAEEIRSALDAYDRSAQRFVADTWRYGKLTHRPYWDGSGYDEPPGLDFSKDEQKPAPSPDGPESPR
jgi:hypothetical protein